MASVVLFNAARTKAIEDNAIVSGLVDSSGNLILTKNNGNQVNAGNVKGPKGDGYQYAIPNTTGISSYIRLATLDGINASGGARFNFLLSGLGDYGTSKSATVLVHAVQRGADTISVSAWGFDLSAANAPITLYSRKLGPFLFEIWYKAPDFQMAAILTSLSAWRATINTDSVTTVAPSNLVGVPIVNAGADFATVEELLAGTIGDKTVSPANFKSSNLGFQTGMMQAYFGRVAPAGWLLCQGQSVSRFTYPDLFNLLNVSEGTVDVSITSPAVVAKTAHGLVNGTRVYFTTTGALPTGLAANTTYFVINSATDTFQLSLTAGGAAINTSGSQSGVHTLYSSAAGVASSTTFMLPDLRGKVAVGRDGSDETFNALGEYGGAKTHTLGYRELPVQKGVRITWGQGNVSFSGSPQAVNTPPEGNGLGTWQNDAKYDADAANNMSSGGQPHNNLQPFIVTNYIIKT